MRIIVLFLMALVLLQEPVTSQNTTYCNPINVDYGYTPIPAFTNWGHHRATADPVMVNYKGTYVLFSTNQWGYWWSKDMSSWNFVSRKFLRLWNNFYDELCAPAVGIIGDTMIVFGSTYTNNFSIWMSTDPINNEWKPLVDSFEIGGWDPDFFTDTDGKLYMYNGSSNRYPMYGIELDRKTLKPKGTRKEVYFLESWRYGWQRFGEHMDNTFLDPFIEGAHVTKHNNKYYLQYGAPGTEFSGYADGVAVSDHPLGYYVNQSDPLSLKLGGFARGAGHGSTFADNSGQYWHISTIGISVKNNFERRLGIWPTGFDSDDIMWCNTAFGDYPTYLPSHRTSESFRPEWYLLNYQTPVSASSYISGRAPNHAVDEDIKTYWSAQSGNPGEWFSTDVGRPMTLHAIQVNFADHDVDTTHLGKVNNQFHQYVIEYSLDGKKWHTAVDKSQNKTDVPHDYIELNKPILFRHIRITNKHMPTGTFALSGLRLFGKGGGLPPREPKQFIVLRTEKDRRSAWLKWEPVTGAQGYNVYYGTHPDKLYTSIMVYGDNQLWLKTLDKEKTYYFTIESFNENGVSNKVNLIKSER